MHERTVESPMGPMRVIASSDGLREIRFGEWAAADDDMEILRIAEAELKAYFAGELRDFAAPIDPVGTDFQLSVWGALREIPFGQTWSYQEQAQMLGRPDAIRAVAAANGRNPLPIVVPCHRVIGSDGSLTGYAGGLDLKRALLELEGAMPASLF